MTTRTRPRPRPVFRPKKPARRTWTPDPRLSAGIALAAEAGHLAGALFEWPASAPRGIFHITAAALLGLVACLVYFGLSRSVRITAIALTLVFPLSWLAGSIFVASPYADFPIVAAITVTLTELTLIGFLAYPNE